jgi:hypothetical protein
MTAVLLTLLITFCFMVVNTAVIEWNQSWVFPEFLSGLEDWARTQEDRLAELTQYFTRFDSFGQYLLGILVIAILPGIGEELLFRGLIQNLLRKGLGNPHLAIWIAAFLFSALHTQFFGLVPRMLLGALFGYLYYYSGRLTLAMLGHFLNNAISLTMAFAFHEGLMGVNPTETERVPQWPVLLVFMILGTVLFVYFQKYYARKNGAVAKGI